MLPESAWNAPKEDLIARQSRMEAMEVDQATEKVPTTSSSYNRTNLKVVAIVVGVIALAPMLSRTPYFNNDKGSSLSDATALQTIESTKYINDDADNNERKTIPIRVACVGDSITYRGCVTNINDTYVSQLSQLLGSDYNVTNYGNSGKTMFKKGLCCRKGETFPCSYWNTSEFQVALTSAPDVVTIVLGTNDAKRCNWNGPPDGIPEGSGHGYVLDYLDMLKLFWSLPSAPKIYLAIPPPLVHPPKHPDQPVPFGMDDHIVNDELPVLIPSIAKEFESKFNTKIGVIDVWSALGGQKGYQNSSMTCDGCHPEKVAFTIIARTFASAILQG